MSARLDFYQAGPEAMVALEQRVAKSSLVKPLIKLVRLRASQINGCAFCLDMHSADARKAGEDERRLAMLGRVARDPVLQRARACRAGVDRGGDPGQPGARAG